MLDKRRFWSFIALGILAACAATNSPSPGDDDTGGAGNAAGSGGTGTTSTGTGTGTHTGAPSGTPSGNPGGECYAGQGMCNPMEGQGCGGGGACDISTDTSQFECRTTPEGHSLAPEGGYCAPESSSFCMNGLTCVASICEAYCCTSDDCGGAPCTAAGIVGCIHLKVCKIC